MPTNVNVLQFPASTVPEKKKPTKPKRPKVTVELGVDPETGNRLQKVFYGKSKKEAESKRRAWELDQARQQAEARERADTGATHAEREQPLSKWINDWLLAYNTTGNYSVSATTEQGGECLKSFLGDMRLCDIRQIDVQRYAASISGRSKSYVSKHKATANRIFKSAVQNRLMLINPCDGVKWDHKGEGTHRFLDEWEIKAIVRHAQSYRVGIWAMLMLFAGLRRGEALALRWTDIDVDAGVIHVTQALHFENNKVVIGAPKTAASVRDVPLFPQLRTALDTARAGVQRGEFICTGEAGQMVTDSIWSSAWRAYISLMTRLINAKPGEIITVSSRKGPKKKEDRPAPERLFSIRSHDLRHTFASMLYDAGVDVKTAQKLLGHTNPEITMRIYTHLSNAKKTASIDKMTAYLSKYDLTE